MTDSKEPTSEHDKALRHVKKRTTAPTADRKGRRRWLYPQRLVGAFSKERRRLSWLLFAIYLIAPWSTWKGLPLIRFEFAHSRFFFAGQVFQFNEFAFVFFGVAALFLSLFFFTALKGRIWCGYACPQTVFLDWLVRPIEELVEGSSHHRKVQDALSPRPLRVWGKKIIKHSLYLILSAGVANTALAYFVDPHTLAVWVQQSPFEHPKPFLLMSVVMALFYFDFAWFREQFCSFLCPYARFQSVLVDENTPSVAYDYNRGEPRGKREKGDCIDCGLCVRVCPTGIDIRDGLQLECIQCMRCEDACNIVMNQTKKPAGLIRMASEAELKTGYIPPFLKKPRVILYGILLVAISSVALGLFLNRSIVELNFVRSAGAAYSEMDDGQRANVWTLNAASKTVLPFTIKLEVLEPDGVSLICARCSTPLRSFEKIRTPVLVRFPKGIPSSLVILREVNSEQILKIPILR